MTAKVIERPSCIKDKHLEYLDGLRESGITNMFGATLFLDKEFPELVGKDSHKILSYWMKTFDERHPVNTSLLKSELKNEWKRLNHKFVFEIDDTLSDEAVKIQRRIAEIEEDLSADEILLLENGFNSDYF